jgi:hypothetical protein
MRTIDRGADSAVHQRPSTGTGGSAIWPSPIPTTSISCTDATVPVTPTIRSVPTIRSPRPLATAGTTRLRAAPVSISTRKRCCATRAHTTGRLLGANAIPWRGISRHDRGARRG